MGGGRWLWPKQGAKVRDEIEKRELGEFTKEGKAGEAQ